MGVQQGKAADHIGQRVLDGQGHSQGQDAGQRDDPGHVNSQPGGHNQTQKQIQHHGGQGADQTVGRFFQF